MAILRLLGGPPRRGFTTFQANEVFCDSIDEICHFEVSWLDLNAPRYALLDILMHYPYRFETIGIVQ